MGAPVEKAKDFKGTIGRLISYLRPFWGHIGLVFVFAIASTLFAIVSPRILGNVTNTIVSGYSQGRLYDQVMSGLPPGTQIPPGTTGADVLAKVPPEVLNEIPKAQQDAIAGMDFSARHGIDFAAIRASSSCSSSSILFSAIFSYVQAWIMAGVSQRVTFDLRDGISRRSTACR